MLTYKYKLYSNSKRGYLDSRIDSFGVLWNYCIAMYRRYYKLFGKTLNMYALMRHITKVKNATHPWMHDLPSQALQDTVKRVHKAYQHFFRKRKNHEKASPPKFKSPRKYKSFTLTQAGYGLCGNRVRIGEKTFGFHLSRPIEGKIKTLTVKRDAVGDFWIIVVTGATRPNEVIAKSGKTVGFDFGMKTFLTASDNQDVEAPLFLQQASTKLRRASRSIARKKRGSHNRKKARIAKARVERHVAWQRQDFQWKLAHKLLRSYDVLCFEDLDLQGIAKRFGKKTTEYSFGEFLDRLEYLSSSYGKQVVRVDRWFPSSKLCNVCGYKNTNLRLKDRVWDCPQCHTHLDRDRNASLNILREGTSSLGSTRKTTIGGGVR